jgi:hypothetical protein
MNLNANMSLLKYILFGLIILLIICYKHIILKDPSSVRAQSACFLLSLFKNNKTTFIFYKMILFQIQI